VCDLVEFHFNLFLPAPKIIIYYAIKIEVPLNIKLKTRI
jgi:hypothetical protein